MSRTRPRLTRTALLGGGTTLDMRDLGAEFGFRSSLRVDGVAAGPTLYSLSATHDRGRDGLGALVTLSAETGSTTGLGIDPFGQSALDGNSTSASATAADGSVTVNARLGYGLDLGRGPRLSANARFDGSSVTVGVDQEGEFGSAGLTYGSTAFSSATSTGSGSTSGIRGALGLNVELRF